MAVTPNNREEPQYENVPEYDEQNYVVRHLPKWSLQGKFLGGRRVIAMMEPLQDLTEDEDQTPPVYED